MSRPVKTSGGPLNAPEAMACAVVIVVFAIFVFAIASHEFCAAAGLPRRRALKDKQSAASFMGISHSRSAPFYSSPSTQHLAIFEITLKDILYVA
jgi:hypothetical protein